MKKKLHCLSGKWESFKQQEVQSINKQDKDINRIELVIDKTLMKLERH